MSFRANQASEMASFVQAKRDLGCKAPQVTVLEEGINTDSRWAKEFWSLLGGKTQYRGLYAHCRQCVVSLNLRSICNMSNMEASLTSSTYAHPAAVCVCVWFRSWGARGGRTV